MKRITNARIETPVYQQLAVYRDKKDFYSISAAVKDLLRLAGEWKEKKGE